MHRDTHTLQYKTPSYCIAAIVSVCLSPVPEGATLLTGMWVCSFLSTFSLNCLWNVKCVASSIWMNGTRWLPSVFTLFFPHPDSWDSTGGGKDVLFKVQVFHLVKKIENFLAKAPQQCRGWFCQQQEGGPSAWRGFPSPLPPLHGLSNWWQRMISTSLSYQSVLK